MKQLSLLFFTLFIGASGYAASYAAQEKSVDQEKSAGQLYQQGDYAGAYAAYQKIERPTKSHQYVMGACSFYLENYPQAVAHWKKAEYGASPRLLRAIDAGMARVYEKNGKEYSVSTWKSVKRFFAVIPLLFLQIFVLLGFLGLFYVHFYFSQYRRLTFWLRVAVITGMIILTQVDERTVGIVRTAVVVRAGPGSGYPGVGELLPLDEVTIEDKEDTWYKIRHSQKIKGWLEDQSVAVIQPPLK